MKIRTGFVSNSSTSSFLMYGVNLEDCPDRSKLYLNLFDVAYEAGIDFRCAYENYYYVGRSLAKIKDDQTFREFKTETIKIVKEFLSKHNINVKDEEFDVYEKAWGNY